MTNDQKTILDILSRELFANTCSLKVEDWNAVYKEAAQQAVSPLVYECIDKSVLPSEVLKMWKNDANAALANNIRIIHNHTLLDQWMGDTGTPYVILKGAASASYYPKPVYRTMGDVDFLVPLEYLDHAGEVLESQGLKRWKQEHDAHIVYRGDEKMHLEMHYTVAGIPEGKPGEIIRDYLKDIFENTRVQNIGAESFVMPSHFHHCLILLLHTIHHLTGEGIGLRHLCDWAVFENSLSDEEFCDLFEEKLKKVGLWRFAQVLTRASIKYLGAEDREWSKLENDAPVDALMEDILSAGNFGNKDRDRSKQTLLISSRGKNGVGHNSMFSQFIRSMNYRINMKWPFTKNNGLCLMLGWILYCVRYVGLIITGKRIVINASELVHESSRRRNIYKNLKLYEM